MKLKAAKRNALRASEFGMPGERDVKPSKRPASLPDSAFAGTDRSYPVEKKSHATNAKARATQMVKRGSLSASAASRIRAKANRILGAT